MTQTIEEHPETSPIILHFNPPSVGTEMEMIGHYTMVQPREFDHCLTRQPEYQLPEYTSLPPW
jgi:hypothetical protein